jgi:molybdopterin-guanine dinucleotide biosynthesis protein A
VTGLVAVLAGGRGRRMGAPKPLVELAGRPLVEHAVAAAEAAGLRAVVVAKPGTPLPRGLTVWQEPEQPVHPLLGIVTALARAGGPVVVTACDMPSVPPELLARLAAGPAAAVLVHGRLEPFPARYDPAWLPALRAALAGGAPVRATLAALAPATVAFDAPAALRSINTPDELAAANDELGDAAGRPR